LKNSVAVIMGVLVALAAGRCAPHPDSRRVSAALLPKKISLHYFTGTRKFGPTGGINGIEARVEAIDYFGDTTKAFGTFRFEMYQFRPHQADPRGKQISQWAVALTDLETNLQYWDSISRTYKFPLAWDQPIPVGNKFVLRVVFTGGDGRRLDDQRVFVSGE